MTENWVEGETDTRTFPLLDDGAATNGVSWTVALILKDRIGGVVDTSATVSWATQSAGTVNFSPNSGDLKADRSPYTARFQLTNTNTGKTKFYPNGDADIWRVRRA